MQAKLSYSDDFSPQSLENVVYALCMYAWESLYVPFIFL